MALGGIGDVSAILGVAQIGLQLAQTLVTVIGDYRDAATNINRLRDEVHLTSICLQQLGDLAKQNLLRDYGILETTNLRDRTRAVLWEIRTTVKKGDNPLHPVEITKEEIDVTYFQSWKWALWTKKQLEEPRQELDRLKDSMTLTFVSHMALSAATTADREKYATQIPGLRRSIAWSQQQPDEGALRKRLQAAGLSAAQVAAILDNDDGADDDAANDDAATSTPEPPKVPGPIDPGVNGDLDTNRHLKAWSLDPLAAVSEIPVTNTWLEQFVESSGDTKAWKTFEKLHPWFKKEITQIFDGLSQDKTQSWNMVYVKPVYKHSWFPRSPRSVQLVMKGEPRFKMAVPQSRISRPAETVAIPYSAEVEIQPVPADVPYNMDDSADTVQGDVANVTKQSDQEIIEQQLALYA